MYDLRQQLRDLNEELFINSHIDKDLYFENEKYIDSYKKELFLINLN